LLQRVKDLEEQIARLKKDSRLLECSDMPPFSWSVQNATGLPVFDFITLIRWIHSGMIQQPYRGFM
jgi:hypothetical protein